MPLLVFVYFFSALAVVVVTPIVRSKALSLGKLDQPCSRKIHSRPMVRLGGVAIFLASFMSLIPGLMNVQLFDDLNFNHGAIPLILGGAAIFFLGLIDDWISLSPLLRLGYQLLVSALVWQGGLGADLFATYGFTSLGWQCLSCLITMVWLTGITNAVNWIDGLDGLATGVCCIAAGCLAFVGIHENFPAVVYLSVSLLGALSGFLRYNFYPAQIFMGDSGSCFLGFTLAGLCLLGPSQVANWRGGVVALAVVALPLVDMVLVIGVRLFSGKSPFQADRSHLHHRLLSMGFPHRAAVEVICLLAFLLSATLLALASYIDLPLYVCLLMAAMLGVIFRIMTSRSINGLLSLSSEVLN